MLVFPREPTTAGGDRASPPWLLRTSAADAVAWELALESLSFPACVPGQPQLAPGRLLRPRSWVIAFQAKREEGIGATCLRSRGKRPVPQVVGLVKLENSCFSLSMTFLGFSSL